jgi:hypothetical protein
MCSLGICLKIAAFLVVASCTDPICYLSCCSLYVPLLSLAFIIPLNIWGVQWFFGSKIFSNGDRIKHPGTKAINTT